MSKSLFIRVGKHSFALRFFTIHWAYFLGLEIGFTWPYKPFQDEGRGDVFSELTLRLSILRLGIEYYKVGVESDLIHPPLLLSIEPKRRSD